jgi:uncharacterized protein YcfJ
MLLKSMILYVTVLSVMSSAPPVKAASTGKVTRYPGFADVISVKEIVQLNTQQTPQKRCTWEQLPDRVVYDRYRQERRVTERRARRCRTEMTSRTVRRVTGYNVTLRYNGETFTRTTVLHPGKRMPVSIEVAPMLN